MKPKVSSKLASDKGLEFELNDDVPVKTEPNLPQPQRDSIVTEPSGKEIKMMDTITFVDGF
jgi:hypothetical protein